ncbi:MAG: D-sedoheptulose 7-phosphate isomerase [Candidatus Omnitrophota bacterium]
MDVKEIIENISNQSIQLKKEFFSDEKNINLIAESAAAIIECYNRGGKVLVCGNGGSAADSQHFAAELVVRFEKERKAFPCIALSTDSSILTAAANDYSFDDVFKRQVQALAMPGDVLIAISTSGDSVNVLEAVKTAKNKGNIIIALTGRAGGKLSEIVDIPIVVKSDSTARVQEVHIMVIHMICKIVESNCK